MIMFPVESLDRKLFFADSGLGRKQEIADCLDRKRNHTDSLRRKPYFEDSKFDRKQEVVHSLGRSQI